MASSPSRAPEYAAVVAGAGSYACLMFVWFSLPATLPTVIDDLGLTGFQAGILAGAVPLTYVPLSLAAGLIVDRVGPVLAIVGGGLVFGAAQVGRSVGGGFPELLAFTVLLGVGATPITFALPKLVSVLFPPEHTGLPSSIYLIGASAGSITAFSVGGPVLAPALGGWRPLFLWSGVGALGYAFVPLAVSRLTAGRLERPADDAELAPGTVREDLVAILTHRHLRLVVVVGTMFLLVFHGLQGWLPTVLEARGLAPDLAGLATGLLIGANVGGILVVPTIAHRFSRPPVAIVACGILVTVGSLGIVLGGTGLPLAGAIGLTGFGLGGLSPLIRSIPPTLEEIGPRLTGVAVGLVFAVGEFGGFVGPVLIGTLYDVTGSYGPGLGALVVAGAMVVAAGLVMERHSAE